MGQSYRLEKRGGAWVVYVDGIAQLCCQRKRTAVLSMKEAGILLGRFLTVEKAASVSGEGTVGPRYPAVSEGQLEAPRQTSRHHQMRRRRPKRSAFT